MSGTSAKVISVGIGEMVVAAPPVVLSAVGIGSCVVVTLRDRANGTGGMAHIMLPWLPKRVKEGVNRHKYADYAIEKMGEEILAQGGARERLVAKIVGGAHMFERTQNTMTLDVGARNLEAVRRKLGQMMIPIVAEDIGGHKGRSVELQLEDGLVRVRTVWRECRFL